MVKVSEFVKKWEEGYDIVYNKREEIQGASRFKRWSSKMFYRIFNAISEIHIESGTTDYRLIDRKVADIFGRYSEKNRMYR